MKKEKKNKNRHKNRSIEGFKARDNYSVFIVVLVFLFSYYLFIYSCFIYFIYF